MMFGFGVFSRFLDFELCLEVISWLVIGMY